MNQYVSKEWLEARELARESAADRNPCRATWCHRIDLHEAHEAHEGYASKQRRNATYYMKNRLARSEYSRRYRLARKARRAGQGGSP